MLYVNIGHGDKAMSTPEIRALFRNSLLWLGSLSKTTSQ
jgi:hypothetical protein